MRSLPPVVAVVALCAVGCTSFPAPPVPKHLVGGARPHGLVDDQPPAFTLRPGDRIRVDVETVPQPESWQATVDAQGTVHLPGLGTLRVLGLTIEQAEARIEGLLRTRDRLGTATVHMLRTDGQRATVLGAVSYQGSIPVSPNMRLSQLIADAGGVLAVPNPITSAPVPVADLQGAVLTRNRKVVPVDVSRAMQGDPRHDVFVHAGDHLFVPRRSRESVSVLGQVDHPGVFVHWKDLRLTEALALAGGVTVGGDKSDIRLLRGPVEAPNVYSADLLAIVDGAASDVMLEPGDVVFVTDHPVEDVGEVFGVLMPIVTLSGASLLLALLIVAQ